MTRIHLVLAAALLAAVPAVSFAADRGRPQGPEDVPYAVKARCDTLKQRFDSESAHPKIAGGLEAARKQAEEGAALCRASRYEEGGNMLAKALSMIGADSK